MIEIKYSNSQTGNDTFFDLLFPVKEYIPESFYSKGIDGCELKFYLSLLEKFDMIEDCKGVSFFWNVHFFCKYRDIPFKLIYDKDYDIVSFCVENKYIQFRKEIAERIRFLIETEGTNTEPNKDIQIMITDKLLFGF